MTFLDDEANLDEAAQMEGKRRARNADRFLQLADGTPVGPGTHQRAIDREPDRLAERFEAGRRAVEIGGFLHAGFFRNRFHGGISRIHEVAPVVAQAHGSSAHPASMQPAAAEGAPSQRIGAKPAPSPLKPVT